MSAWNDGANGQDYEFSQVKCNRRWCAMRDRGINQRMTRSVDLIGWEIRSGYSVEKYGREARADRGDA
jgi:hypothetical protein